MICERVPSHRRYDRLGQNAPFFHALNHFARSLPTIAAEELDCSSVIETGRWGRAYNARKSPDSEESRLIECLTGRRAILASDRSLTTFAAEELNCRVRDGNGCDLLAMVTRKLSALPECFGSCTKCEKKCSSSLARAKLYVSPRPLSIGHLNALLRSQLRPIKPVVFRGSYSFDGKSNLEVCLALRCFQRLSLPDVATQRMRLAAQLVHQRSVHSGPLVLRATPLKFPTCVVDRDRTGSRRSEPSSRAALIRELRNPWDRVQPQDATSRHRGAKPSRRCGLLGRISLLSPEYLLSVERRQFHS